MHGGMGLEELLEASLDRRYSANPGEAFFTGGGRHTFHNFDRDDNGRVLPLREALRHSTNLVFIRLMRDLVRFHRARLPYDVDAVLHDPADPTRKRMLEEIGDGEARQALRSAYRSYRSLAPAAIVQHLLGSRAGAPRQLAMLFYAWHIGADGEQLGAWLAQHGAAVAPQEVARLQRAYGNPRLNLSDFGYLLSATRSTSGWPARWRGNPICRGTTRWRAAPRRAASPPAGCSRRATAAPRTCACASASKRTPSCA